MVGHVEEPLQKKVKPVGVEEKDGVGSVLVGVWKEEGTRVSHQMHFHLFGRLGREGGEEGVVGVESDDRTVSLCSLSLLKQVLSKVEGGVVLFQFFKVFFLCCHIVQEAFKSEHSFMVGLGGVASMEGSLQHFKL